MAEGTRGPAAAPSWESSPAAFVLVGAAGVVSVVCGDDRQVRVGLRVQAAPASSEAPVRVLGSQRRDGTCRRRRVPGPREQRDRAHLTGGQWWSGGLAGKPEP